MNGRIVVLGAGGHGRGPLEILRARREAGLGHETGEPVQEEFS